MARVDEDIFLNSMTNHPIIAFVQHAPVFLNLEASTEKACDFIEEAAAEADIVVFPETWLPGYPVWLDSAPDAAIWDHPTVKKIHRILRHNAVKDDHQSISKLKEKAASAGVYVVMGAHEKEGGTLYNTTYYLDNEGNFCKHRKLMPTYTERLVWGLGDGSMLATVPTQWGTIGGLICWEHWMPLARAAMHAKKESIHIAQWPWVKDLHLLCSKHYAFEAQCFVAASGGILSKDDMLQGVQSLDLPDDDGDVIEFLQNIPLDSDEMLQRGGSTLIAPDTTLVIEPVYDKTGIFYAEIDLNQIAEGNLYMDSDGHYARPDVFQLRINTSSQNNVIFQNWDLNDE